MTQTQKFLKGLTNVYTEANGVQHREAPIPKAKARRRLLARPGYLAYQMAKRVIRSKP